MHSYILTGGTKDSRSSYLHALLTSSTELLHIFTEKSSITLKQIHALLVPLSINPRLPRLVWIEEASLATPPAQNALLKMLEEPPPNTTFYLSCQTATSLFPTIRSRCQTITLNFHTSSALYPLSTLKEIMALSPGDRLAGAPKRDRSDSILWFTQIEQALSAKLHEPGLAGANYQTLAKIATLSLTAHSQLLANCSVSLVTQNFLLSLPKIK